MYSIVVLSVLLGTVTCLVGWRPCPTPPPALPAGEAGAELCTSAIPLLLGRSVCLKPRAEREVGVAETPRSWRRGDVPLRPELAGGTRHSGAAVEQVGQTGINTARAGVLMPRFGPVTAIFTVVPVSSIATGSIAVDYGNLVARPRADAETWRCTAATTATIQCLWTRHDERYSADDGGRLSGRDEDEKRGTAAGHRPTGWPDSARRGGRGGGIMQMRERGAARGHGRNKFRRPTRTPGDGGAKFGGRPRGVVRAGKGRGRDAQECHQCVPRASPPPLHSAC